MEADNETQILGLPMTHKFVRFLIPQILFLICIVKCNNISRYYKHFVFHIFAKLPWPLLQIKNATFLELHWLKSSHLLISFVSIKPFN